MVDTASYHRAMWYHKKRFSAWAKEELQPLIDELVEAAKTAPQYDWRFLYELEYYKLPFYWVFNMTPDMNTGQ